MDTLLKITRKILIVVMLTFTSCNSNQLSIEPTYDSFFFVYIQSAKKMVTAGQEDVNNSYIKVFLNDILQKKILLPGEIIKLKVSGKTIYGLLKDKRELLSVYLLTLDGDEKTIINKCESCGFVKDIQNIDIYLDSNENIKVLKISEDTNSIINTSLDGKISNILCQYDSTYLSLKLHMTLMGEIISLSRKDNKLYLISYFSHEYPKILFELHEKDTIGNFIYQIRDDDSKILIIKSNEINSNVWICNLANSNVSEYCLNKYITDAGVYNKNTWISYIDSVSFYGKSMFSLKLHFKMEKID